MMASDTSDTTSGRFYIFCFYGEGRTLCHLRH